jgi:hypothetical protein
MTAVDGGPLADVSLLASGIRAVPQGDAFVHRPSF